jgi:hypothetical protein
LVNGCPQVVDVVDGRLVALRGSQAIGHVNLLRLAVGIERDLLRAFAYGFDHCVQIRLDDQVAGQFAGFRIDGNEAANRFGRFGDTELFSVRRN